VTGQGHGVTSSMGHGPSRAEGPAVSPLRANADLDIGAPRPTGERVPEGRVRGRGHGATSTIGHGPSRAAFNLLVSTPRPLTPNPSPRWGEGNTISAGGAVEFTRPAGSVRPLTLDPSPRWGEGNTTSAGGAGEFTRPAGSVRPLTPDPSPRWGEGNTTSAGGAGEFTRSAGSVRLLTPDPSPRRGEGKRQHDRLGRSQPGRPGLSAIEVIVVLVIVALAVLVLLVMVPHGREQARLLACQKNLSQIGVALAMYDQTERRLPLIAALAALDDSSPARPAGPLRTLLEAMQLPDLTELKPGEPLPAPRPGEVPTEMPVRGFVCQSDPNATAGLFTAPVSYRATTGDSPRTGNGAFAPGRVLTLPQIEAADGLSYTAAFSERLVGDQTPNHPAIGNYQAIPGPVSASGCPPANDPALWRGDAGSSWSWSDYRSTLYHHALAPNGQPSCIALDGQSAFMGASSGHLRGVNVLMLDGRVDVVRPSVNLKVWRELAAISELVSR
jgi:prepilin-type processing-associated H-X9-DG protein